MRRRDDEISLNVSLAEKLRGFGIRLPELPEGDEWLPNAYMDAVATEIAGQRRWEVERNGVALGFFTFSKLLMWLELDPDAWPDGNGIVEHDIVTKLLGEGPPGEPEPPLAPDDEPIDGHLDLAAAVHVLDADSSQALCIEEALRGRNLVVQGPPGTGKSQTIANIIATAAYDGRSVLFVAEKAAALDVVHGRLKSVGLEALCLEIHSKKATKLSVIASLDRALRASGIGSADSRTAAELRSARDQLNEWSGAVHRQIRRSGRTPYQVMGTVLKLCADQVRVLDRRLDAGEWDRDQLQEAERAVERAASAVEKLRTVPFHHPWYGVLGDRLTPLDAQRLNEALRTALEQARSLILSGGEVAGLLQVEAKLSRARLRGIVEALRILGRCPLYCRELLSQSGWRKETPRITQILEHGKLWSLTRAELSGSVNEAAWSADIAPVRHAMAAHGKSWIRGFIGRYRRAVTELRGFCREHPPPRKIEDRLLLLDKIIAAQSARLCLRNDDEFGRAILGSIWASEETPWPAVEALLGWAKDAGHSNLSADLLTLAPSIDPSSCSSLADKLEAAIAEFDANFTKVVEVVRPDFGVVFDAVEIESVSLSTVSDKLDRWAQALDVFNDWVGARGALDALRRHGMRMIAGGLEDGTVKPSQARPITDLLIAEALWRCACADDPTLDRIDGGLRSEIVSRFRDLDRKRVELARLEVLARYLEGRPNGGAGEMGIVRAEIGKRRRHLPIRKLMEIAGSAVQTLNPIFLMSPLSVAQFLSPGRVAFDLVVIDEASQVPPEEALGVIARGRQIIVVGDDKQLPPTNFFRMVSAEEDEDDDEADAATRSSRPQNFESILTLARVRGNSERMLRWHYRSRHPSLIALSNHSCYGGNLLLPPSPLPRGQNLGLSLVKTPRGHYDRGGSGRNPVEADLVGEAVEHHLTNQQDRSLGIACFSVAQRDAIEDALQARGLLTAVECFSPNNERLFVKNLEAVQGDERDTIFISIGYGPDAQGRMTVGFGPLSADGGERRLNVLISRARLQCVVFSSITSGDIPADVKPRGTRMLREFLHFAETGHLAAGEVTAADFDSPFEEAVAIAIRRAGYEVVPQVGVSGFRVDLGVLSQQQSGRFLLGIECDGAAYHSARSARDRDRLRQEVLEGLGWKLYRVWSTDWFRNPLRETERILSAIEAAAEAERSLRSCQPERKQAPSPVVSISNTSNLPEQEQVTAKEFARSPISPPYQECELTVPRGAELLSVDRSRLAELAAAVVYHEGPIHSDEVARRVREAFGRERTGRRILEAVSAALKQALQRGILTREGEFWSYKDQRLKSPRGRREAAVSLKRPDRIAPEEYRLAIRAVLNECVAGPKSEIVVEVARIFGFDRTGNGLDRMISEQIDRMVKTGEIDGAEDSIRIARSASTG